MALDEIPEVILRKHPELVRVSEALDTYRQGIPVTTCCAICGQLLEVTEVVEIGTLWVKCKTGCTSFRARRQL